MPDCVNPTTDVAVVMGPCCCGGYGVVLDEKHAREEGRCHIPPEDYGRRSPAEKEGTE